MLLMNILEPITEKDLYSLRPGEWIWDNKRIGKPAHKRSLKMEKVFEPIGFRQIHILDVYDYPKKTDKPFMLTDHISERANSWEPYEYGRYFRVNWDLLTGLSNKSETDGLLEKMEE